MGYPYPNFAYVLFGGPDKGSGDLVIRGSISRKGLLVTLLTKSLGAFKYPPSTISLYLPYACFIRLHAEFIATVLVFYTQNPLFKS